MEIEIRWETDRRFHPETAASWDAEPEWLINPGRKPTEREMAECPKLFTCYCCSGKHPKAELGGRYHGKWFCSGCIPFVDEWTAGAMITWAENRKKHPFSAPRPSKPSPTLADRLEKMVEAMNWAKAQGYTLP